MLVVYILFSKSKTKYYIGHTKNLSNRLNLHNQGKVKSTKFGIPWKVVYIEKQISKQEAYKRELQIKFFKGGRVFKELIK